MNYSLNHWQHQIYIDNSILGKDNEFNMDVTKYSGGGHEITDLSELGGSWMSFRIRMSKTQLTRIATSIDSIISHLQ